LDPEVQKITNRLVNFGSGHRSQVGPERVAAWLEQAQEDKDRKQIEAAKKLEAALPVAIPPEVQAMIDRVKA